MWVNDPCKLAKMLPYKKFKKTVSVNFVYFSPQWFCVLWFTTCLRPLYAPWFMMSHLTIFNVKCQYICMKTS